MKGKIVVIQSLVKIMRSKYNIELAPSGGMLKEKLLRIGNYGNINQLEIDEFLNSLKLTIKEINNNENKN